MGKEHSQGIYKYKWTSGQANGRDWLAARREHPCHPALLPLHSIKPSPRKATSLPLRSVENRQFCEKDIRLILYLDGQVIHTFLLSFLFSFLWWGRLLHQTMSLVFGKNSTARNVSVAGRWACLLGFCTLPIRQQLDWTWDKYLCHLAKCWLGMPCNLNLWLNESQNIKVCLFKYLKASQLRARMHTLLGKQGSFCFLFIVLTIWISLKKT